MYPLLDEITNWFRKIDFMIIGTQKGGSTALHDYLHHHPSCWGSFFKEPGFFLYPTEYAKGFPFLWNICGRNILLSVILYPIVFCLNLLLGILIGMRFLKDF